MKKLLTVVTSLGLVLCACGGSSSIDAKDLGTYLKDKASFDSKLVKVDAKRISTEIGLEEDDYEEIYHYAAGGAIAEEVIVITSDDTDKIEDKLEDYKDQRETVFESYAPKEAKKLDDAEVEVKDNAVVLVVSKDDSKISKILKEYK